MKAGAAMPLEKRDTPFQGTVTLYARLDCLDFGLIGLTKRTLEVTEHVCYDDSVLGLGGFQSFIFERTGPSEDPKSRLGPEYQHKLIASGFVTGDCLQQRGGRSSFGEIAGSAQSTGCVSAREGKVARGFTFRRSTSIN
jgi:hypothetical protein